MAKTLWPDEQAISSAGDCMERVDHVRPALLAKLREAGIDGERADSLCRVYLPLAAWVHEWKQAGSKPLVLGVNGAQGTGKTTLSECLRLILCEGYGYRVAGFSIDDFYKTRAERQRLGREVHPLLATRGVPGTHDLELCLNTLRALIDPRGGKVFIPAFDKATDDRRPESEWPVFGGAADAVIFEGWCVGTAPQSEEELVAPINDLERYEDASLTWRRYVNRQLQGPYAELFGQIDRLIMLRAPDMESVHEWRCLQERMLAAKSRSAGGGRHLMDETGLKRFIMHYERLTRHALAEMPDRADVILFLNPNHQFTHIHIRP